MEPTGIAWDQQSVGLGEEPMTYQAPTTRREAAISHQVESHGITEETVKLTIITGKYHFLPLTKGCRQRF